MTLADDNFAPFNSLMTDLTQRSAMALAHGDLNGVRTWAIPILRTRRWNLAP
jgi:hypothetical protein